MALFHSSAWYQQVIIKLQFFTDCQCIYNPSISVWAKNGTLGDFYPFNIGEEHDNEFNAFASHIISYFQFFQVLRQFQ